MTSDPINADLQAIRDRLTPKQPDDATVLEHLQTETELEGEVVEEPVVGEASAKRNRPAPTNRAFRFFLWLDSTCLSWMDTKSGQYVAYVFLAGVLIWSVSLLIPSERRMNQTLRQVYEYCKE